MKILYVEDNAAARYLLETLLKASGYQIVCAENGEEALKLLHREAIDLIISDILMPKLDGFTLCHLLKSDAGLAAIPLVFYSATYTQPEDMDFARTIGAVDFLIKPQPPEEFLRRLQAIIQALPQTASQQIALDELNFLKGYAQRVGAKLEATHDRLDQARQQLNGVRQELRQARQMLSSLIDHFSDAVLVVDAAGGLSLTNQGFKKMFPESAGQPIDRLECILPLERCQALYQLLDNQTEHASEFHTSLLNGIQVLATAHVVWFSGQQAILLVLRNLDNYLSGHVPGDLHAHVLENLVEGVMITDADNNIISVNPAFVRITGYSPAEVLGKSPRMFKSAKQDLAFYKRMWSSLLSDGKWQGEIWNRCKNGDVYPEWLFIGLVYDPEGTVAFHVAIFSDISEHEQARQNIEHMAHHDALTDLPNRTLLNYRLTDAIHDAARHRRKTALLYLDLDRFKMINDSLGHHVGDELLKTVATRLRRSVRQVDTVGRQGGDEFLIVIADLVHEDDAIKVAEKILQAIREPYLINGQELNMTPSIGIATYPDHGIDAHGLIQCADTALYQAKDEGRNNIKLYNPSMSRENELRLILSNALAHALELNQLRLVYQPQVRMTDNRVVGCEVLLRWRHPELGEVSPANFIPLAEENGRINAIGEWVLRSACLQAAKWQRELKHPFSIAVNLSAIQFRQSNLLDTIQTILDQSGLASSALELELTESILMHEANATLEMLQKLKAMNIKLSIDDFGTGYSNLSYLNRFAVNKLKIDQSFVFGLPNSNHDAAIVQAIVQLAQSLDLEVIAEGVETAEQRDFLIAQGCLLAQGYFYAKPLEAADFEKLLVEGLPGN